MLKTKTIFICQNCGVQSPKWVGRCVSCNEWNTYVEEAVLKKKPGQPSIISKGLYPVNLQDVDLSKQERIDMLNGEFNRVLGGGLVPGSVVLLGGEPGVGKSTLVLQVALSLKGKKTLYISGEESLQQLKMRAKRISRQSEDCYFLCETSVEIIISRIEELKPNMVIVDSIQTLSTEMVESSPGSVTQVRECTTSILKYAKIKHIPVILIGHINKEGSLAGPKVLEHIVDTVLQFEGDRNYLYRILRSIKNRYGSTSELGVFEMCQDGLREVPNPSEILLSHNNKGLSGTSIASSVEGMRVFMVETQGLVSSAVYGTPQRSATGFDLRRMNMLLAVLEKRAGFRLMTKDVFLNIAGGLRVDDPAMDLSVIAAILSSNFDVAINKQICFAGEVGLTGEIRPVSRIDQRIMEAEKLGFEEIYTSKYKNGNNFSRFNIKVTQIERIEKLIKLIFR